MLCLGPWIPVPVLTVLALGLAYFVWRVLKPIAPREPARPLLAWAWTAAALLTLAAFFASFGALLIGTVMTPDPFLAACGSLLASAVLPATFRSAFRDA